MEIDLFFVVSLFDEDENASERTYRIKDFESGPYVSMGVADANARWIGNHAKVACLRFDVEVRGISDPEE